MTSGSYAVGSCFSAWRKRCSASGKRTRLIGDRAQRIPGGGELRRQLDRVLQMFLGGIHVALLQIALRVRVVAQGAIGDGELARGDGVAAAVAGGVEILVLQRDGKLDAVARIGQARTHFDGLARFAASGLEDGHGVSRGGEFLEGEAPVLVGESGGGEGMGGAEQGDRRSVLRG